ESLYPLPWLNLDLEYARQTMGDDFYSYGVKKNLPTLEAATLYSYEQALTERRFEVNELFAPETVDLFNDDRGRNQQATPASLLAAEPSTLGNRARHALAHPAVRKRTAARLQGVRQML